MSTKNFTIRSSFMTGLLLFVISSGVYAQRGRGHSYGNSHGHYHGYGGYSYGHSHGYNHGYGGYSYPRSYISIGFGGFHYGYYGGYYYRPYPYYRRVYAGVSPYYYYNDRYYSPSYRNDAPPLGAKVSELPGDAQSVIINGQKYYVLDGVYFKEEINRDNQIEYVVVGRNGLLNTDNENMTPGQDNDGIRIGDRVSKLPPDCRTIVISGKKYYMSPDGIYYEEIISPNKVEYEVVGKPDER